MNLNTIGRKYGTDKCNINHSQDGLSMLSRYEKYLINKRIKKNNILEIGVLNGASIRTWKEYFENSNIVGLDIDPRCKSFEQERIQIYIGSQGDEEIKNKIQKRYNSFDFIIDDGSHVNSLTIKSFELYWPLLNKGGIYIIEDIFNTYSPAMKNWPGMKYNDDDLDYNNNREEFEKFLIHELIRNVDKIDSDIFSVNIYMSTIVIRKNVN